MPGACETVDDCTAPPGCYTVEGAVCDHGWCKYALTVGAACLTACTTSFECELNLRCENGACTEVGDGCDAASCECAEYPNDPNRSLCLGTICSGDTCPSGDPCLCTDANCDERRCSGGSGGTSCNEDVDCDDGWCVSSGAVCVFRLATC